MHVCSMCVCMCVYLARERENVGATPTAVTGMRYSPLSVLTHSSPWSVMKTILPVTVTLAMVRMMMVTATVMVMVAVPRAVVAIATASVLVCRLLWRNKNRNRGHGTGKKEKKKGPVKKEYNRGRKKQRTGSRKEFKKREL